MDIFVGALQRKGSIHAQARYEEKLNALPPTGAGYHPALLGVANAGVSAGLSDSELLAGIRRHTNERARRVPDSEIQQAIDKARQGRNPLAVKRASSEQRPTPAPKIHLPCPPAIFRRRLIEAGRKYTATDFFNRSTMQLTGYPPDDSLCILEAFYSANEYLFIGSTYCIDVYRVADFKDLLLDPQNGSEFMPFMPHIIPNPVTGEQHETKDGRLSKRCDAAIKDYRFAVAEFDSIPRADQLAFWATVPLPIAALIDSGGKSIHAWIKLEQIYTPEDWRITVKETLYRQMLVPMGCDPACANPSRLSRFPGHFRADKGSYQKLIYINQSPNPKGIFRD